MSPDARLRGLITSTVRGGVYWRFAPGIRVGKVVRRFRQVFEHRFREFRDRRYSTSGDTVPAEPILRYFTGVELPGSFLETMRHLTEHYLAHRFDVLGSGWVQVKHGMSCRGFEGYRYIVGDPPQVDPEGRWLAARLNPANVEAAQQIWRLIQRPYTPIDWHLDIKSGYRWSERLWYLNVPIAPRPGVDIKVPWELARMHHLPSLAWAYAGAAIDRDGFRAADTYVREFRNQLLDFIATNPPRFGVNWRSTMDVALRVANWLVAYDLFRAYGATFDEPFDRIFRRSVYEHGCHIVTNLEWDPLLRTNHYLSNVVGLLFAAAYLPRTPQTDSWLAFAVQELVSEVGYQFNADGTCFEASTCYHRLSAEMVVYATVLVLGLLEEKRAALVAYDHRLHRLPPPLRPAPLPMYPLGGGGSAPFPAWYSERLARMAEFTQHITKPSGRVPQIGDNDSGRFLKLEPVYRPLTVAEAKARQADLAGYTDLPDDDIYWAEDVLDHRHLNAAVTGLLGAVGAEAEGKGSIEARLVSALARRRLPSYRAPTEPAAAEQVLIGTDDDWARVLADLSRVPHSHRDIMEMAIPGGQLRHGLKLHGYPDFGLYLFHSARLYLGVRCGPIGQSGVGGHAHNDQLSIELTVDGEDWTVDPGTYVYTPLPALRQRYRSGRAHFAPHVDGEAEPGRLDLGLFRLGDEAQARCLYFGERGFIGTHRGYGKPVYRVVEVGDEVLCIRDYSLGRPLIRQATRFAGRDARSSVFVPFSPAYGVRYA